MTGTNVYLIKLWDEEESFYKIGVSVHKYCRFYEIMKFGYRVEIVFMPLKLEFYKAHDLESYLHSRFSEHYYMPKKKFGGYTECFKDLDIDEYKHTITKNINASFDYIENLEITWR